LAQDVVVVVCDDGQALVVTATTSGPSALQLSVDMGWAPSQPAPKREADG
jgi:hypothetical protein